MLIPTVRMNGKTAKQTASSQMEYDMIHFPVTNITHRW